MRKDMPDKGTEEQKV